MAAETESVRDVRDRVRLNNAELVAGLAVIYKLHLEEIGVELDKVKELAKPGRLLSPEELKQLIR